MTAKADMPEQNTSNRVWDIIEQLGLCMVTTIVAGVSLRARPLEARPDRETGIIWFVTDVRSDKEHELEVERNVGIIFVDAKAWRRSGWSFQRKALGRSIYGHHARHAEAAAPG